MLHSMFKLAATSAKPPPVFAVLGSRQKHQIPGNDHQKCSFGMYRLVLRRVIVAGRNMPNGLSWQTHPAMPSASKHHCSAVFGKITSEVKNRS